MVDTVQVGIDKDKAILSFNRDVDELAGLSKSDFSFNIEDGEDGKQVGIFQAKRNGQLLRENRSKQFPSGAVTKKSEDLNKVNFNVRLKVHDPSIDLTDIFSP